MKIAINVNELTLKQETGVKVYTREIVGALEKIDKENEYILYANNCDRNVINRVSTNSKFKIQNSKFNYPFWTYTKFPQEIKKDKPDILFMPIQAVPFFKKPKNLKIVVTVHDLAFLLFPDHFTAKDKFLLYFHTKRAVAMADAIITPSEATKKDIIKFYKTDENKIKVIYHGITNHESRITNHEFKANNPYILFVGQIQPRKNLIRLIEAFETIKTRRNEALPRSSSTLPRLRLIIAGGKGWMANKTYEKAKKSEFSEDIIFTGKVSDKDLAKLYQNALMFVLPSLYEGFGLPVLEAMSYGVPCVVSDNSSLSEIVDDHALLANANSSDDIAQKIGMFLNNEPLRKDFAERSLENAKEFSWNKAAKKTLEVFESVQCIAQNV